MQAKNFASSLFRGHIDIITTGFSSEDQRLSPSVDDRGMSSDAKGTNSKVFRGGVEVKVKVIVEAIVEAIVEREAGSEQVVDRIERSKEQTTQNTVLAPLQYQSRL